MDFIESKTIQNLAKAYAAECQCRTRYEFIEYGARYNGYKNIADIIDEMVYHEFNHARMFYTYIQNYEKKQVDNINIEAGYPFKEKWDLMENLRLAADDEKGDSLAYSEFAKIAKEEGFDEIATLFLEIKKIEDFHRKVFLELYTQMKEDTLYKKEMPVIWVCADCGYMATGREPWTKCPVCEADRGSVKLVLDTLKSIEN